GGRARRAGAAADGPDLVRGDPGPAGDDPGAAAGDDARPQRPVRSRRPGVGVTAFLPGITAGFGQGRTPERPGPGPTPEALLRALDLTVGRRIRGLLPGGDAAHC